MSTNLALPRISKKHLLAALTLAFAAFLAVGLVGCGGGGSSSSDASNQSQDQGQSQSQEPSTPIELESTASEPAVPDASAFYGDWHGTSIETGKEDSTVHEEDMAAMAALDLYLTLTFKEDGTWTLDTFGERLDTGTWEATSDTTAVMDIEGETIEATLSGDDIRLVQGTSYMTFIRASSDTRGADSGAESAGGHAKGSTGEEPAPALQPGWNEVDGQNVYVNEDGTVANGWVKIDKKWYLFNEGVATTGMAEDDGNYYWFDDDGVMLTGWQNDGEHYHYYNPSNGKALIGWQEIDGVWYVFDERGNMRTGWYTDDKGQEFYLGNNGKMRTGWVDIEESSYYFNESGKLQKDTWIDGYYVDEWGEWVEGRQPLPSNGTVFAGGGGYSSITVNGSTERNALIKMKDSSGNVVAAFFVAKGSTVTVSMPGGYYYMYAAYGNDEWYGWDVKYPFGGDSSFSMDDEGADFATYSWEYTLYSVSGGNFSMDDISADEF